MTTVYNLQWIPFPNSNPFYSCSKLLAADFQCYIIVEQWKLVLDTCDYTCNSYFYVSRAHTYVHTYCLINYFTIYFSFLPIPFIFQAVYTSSNFDIGIGNIFDSDYNPGFDHNVEIWDPEVGFFHFLFSIFYLLSFLDGLEFEQSCSRLQFQSR